MNLCGSPKNHENRNVYAGTLSHCLSEARWAGFFLNCSFQIRRGGDRLRGGGDHHTWRSVKKNFVSYQNSSIFMGNAQLPALRFKGASPPPLWFTRRDNPRPGALSSSLSAREIGRDRLMSPPSSHQPLEFHIKTNGILRSR
jgi:hypothetical protein